APVQVERGPSLGQALGQALDLAPGVIAPRRRAPGTAMAFDRAERGLRALGALAVGQLVDVERAELLGQMTQAAGIAPAVARHVERRGGPEDLLDHAGLEPHLSTV